MLGIVVSRADEASVAIGEQLRAIEDWERTADGSRPDADGGGTVYRTEGATLREFEEWHLELDRPAEAFDEPDLLVFASRHSGETGPLLTAHHTGNFGPAEFGGEDNALARACPNAHAAVLDSLADHAPEGYEVGMECTHHGPTDVGAPSMFVEVGSAEPQWRDDAAARAVARAILELRGVPPDRPTHNGDDRRRHLVGFGGGHYAPRFERVCRETDWAVGHIAADWGLEALDDADRERVIRRAFERSAAAYALVDGDRPELVETVAGCGYRAVGETWVRETDGVDLRLVGAVEAELTTVGEGLRFGERARNYEGVAFAVVELPEALLDEVRGIDRGAATGVLEELTLAFVTDQGGTRPTGPVAVPDEADREAVVDGLADILGQRYDSVDRRGDRIVARERGFDPGKAKTLGVPEGPAFGRLANGETVEVDGRTIPPEEVETEREVEFEI